MLTYDSITYTPDQIAAVDDVNAIYMWSVQQRTKIDQYPSALPLIDDFESWYGSLEERASRSAMNPLGIGVHAVDQADVNEAKRRKLAIQAAIHDQIPPDYPVPGHAPPAIPPHETTIAETIVYTAVGLGAGYALLKLLS